jgi:hypothetical protein
LILLARFQDFLSWSAISLLILNSQFVFLDTNAASKQRQDVIGGMLVSFVILLSLHNITSHLKYKRSEKITNKPNTPQMTTQYGPMDTITRAEQAL